MDCMGIENHAYDFELLARKSLLTQCIINLWNSPLQGCDEDGLWHKWFFKWEIDIFFGLLMALGYTGRMTPPCSVAVHSRSEEWGVEEDTQSRKAYLLHCLLAWLLGWFYWPLCAIQDAVLDGSLSRALLRTLTMGGVKHVIKKYSLAKPFWFLCHCETSVKIFPDFKPRCSPSTCFFPPRVYVKKQEREGEKLPSELNINKTFQGEGEKINP